MYVNTTFIINIRINVVLMYVINFLIYYSSTS